ncbi:MAG: YqgE/AlgH family protein [Saprospiraceae bacterium]|nr:YqgE/AlgH family protein [Saprospiraceae bacterium]MCB0542244.1 YqgE/AlgH family protein [Saprospiraceae bacterium]
MAAKSLIKNGQLLLAEPFMQDPYFRRAVVLLCEHHDEGSIGFILNKSIEMGVNDLMSDFPKFDAEVFYGGPVQTDTLHYVHNFGEQLEESVKVSDGVWWGGDFDKLKFLISSELVQPENIRFFVGYSGWSGGQLEEEMEYGSWVAAPMDANYIFKLPPARLWSQIMYNKGDLYEIIADMPEMISWN